MGDFIQIVGLSAPWDFYQPLHKEIMKSHGYICFGDDLLFDGRLLPQMNTNKRSQIYTNGWGLGVDYSFPLEPGWAEIHEYGKV